MDTRTTNFHHAESACTGNDPGRAVPGFTESHELLEALAALEHAQWLHWSQSVAPQVAPEVSRRWRESWVPYEALPESLKELDRVWARRVLGLLQERGCPPNPRVL